jgi:hypothetical protein
MNILVAGDIVGSPGRTVFARTATRMKASGEVDFVIANAENAAGGRGITSPLAEELFAGGGDILTLGDHTWDQKELIPYFSTENRLLRPANFAPGCPGNGWYTLHTEWSPVTVINLVGRVFLSPAECPFRTADRILASLPHPPGIIIVDMHAEATSEKIAMGRYLDGRVTAVVGTHTHIPTADERLLPKGTAYITDLGMTGPRDSVLGREVDAVLQKFVTGMPTRFKIASEDVALEGVLLQINDQTGRALSIQRVRIK